MRIATFNVENLFSRASVMNLDTWAEGGEVLSDVQTLNSLIEKKVYSSADKEIMSKLLEKYEFNNRDKVNRPFSLVEIRSKLYKVNKDNNIEIVAAGSDGWLGWVELQREGIEDQAIKNTARVIAEVGADILCTVEVENRMVLSKFNKLILKANFGLGYAYNMLVDGNDARGIDIGLLSNHKIVSVRSHVEDGGEKPIFSRDCPEFEVALPNSDTLWILGNHLKSKGYGNPSQSNKKRWRQAAEVAKIYVAARERSDYVLVMGDFNDFPGSDALRPLLEETDLRDVMSHPSYAGKPGTYGSCNSVNQKIDYILLSPALWERVQAVGVETRGIYAPRSGLMFDTVTGHKSAASDHAAVWVDIE